jgi:hypothetical protein
MRRALAIAALGLALAGALAAAEEPAPETDENDVDRAHAAVSRSVIDAGRRLDRFFSDERIEEEVPGSRIRLRGGFELRRGPDVDLGEDVDAKIALPRTEQRFQLLFGRVGVRNQEDDDLLTDRERESEYLTGLRVLLRENAWLRLQADGGSKFRPVPDPFTRLRARLLYELDPWAFRLTETGFWFSRDGYGQTTRVDVDREFGERFFARATAEATVSETSDGVEWAHRLSLQRVLSPRRAIAFDVEMFGPTEPATVVEEYETSLRYRQRIWREWLFYEIEPALVFPRERGYQLRPELTFRLEIVLGSLGR